MAKSPDWGKIARLGFALLPRHCEPPRLPALFLMSTDSVVSRIDGSDSTDHL